MDHPSVCMSDCLSGCLYIGNSILLTLKVQYLPYDTCIWTFTLYIQSAFALYGICCCEDSDSTVTNFGL